MNELVKENRKIAAQHIGCHSFAKYSPVAGIPDRPTVNIYRLLTTVCS